MFCERLIKFDIVFNACRSKVLRPGTPMGMFCRIWKCLQFPYFIKSIRFQKTFCLEIENNVSLCFKLSSFLSMSNYWLHNTIILFSDWRDTCSCLSVNEWQVLSNSINWTNDGTSITTKSENTHKQVFLKECWRTIYSYLIFL